MTPSTLLDPPAATRPLLEIRPTEIFERLRTGVLGQNEALRYVAVAVYKHTTGAAAGNLLLVGSSGTGKTTIMNNLQRLYDELPEYRPFRAVTIINANLLVDPDRLEFRPDRLLAAVEQRVRAVLGEGASPEALTEALSRATICIDEIDKMSTVVAGKPNPLGVVLQQGLLTLLEGERLTWSTHATVNGVEKDVRLPIDTKGMMFICGGAFEGLYDQVYLRVTKPGAGERLRTHTVRDASGQVRIEERFALGDFLKPRDLFDYGMVPQFLARFDKTVLLADLGFDSLREILLHSHDSPFVRSKRFFATLGIDLSIDDLAASLIAEQAAKDPRTGARALRPLFSEIVNPLEYDPWDHQALEVVSEGRWRLRIDDAMVREAKH
jgi:ATP-dependent Clp protease ATP-binding subunit ClpX